MIDNVEIVKQNNVTFLFINEELIMSDAKYERDIEKELANKAYGDVLVAGYGLSIVQGYLIKNPKVFSVTTIENNKELLSQMKNMVGELAGEVIESDFFEYIPEQKYDCVIGNILPSKNFENIKEYKKFIKKAKTLIKESGKIITREQDYHEFLLKEGDSNA